MIITTANNPTVLNVTSLPFFWMKLHPYQFINFFLFLSLSFKYKIFIGGFTIFSLGPLKEAFEKHVHVFVSPMIKYYDIANDKIKTNNVKKNCN